MPFFLVLDAAAQAQQTASTVTRTADAAASTAVAPKDLIGWFFTAIGIAASLFWNWKNSQKAERVRKLALKVEEFKRVRDPIEIELRDILALKRKIEPFAASTPTAASFKKSVIEFNKQITEHIRRLEDALDHANTSGMIDGQDWGVPSDQWDAVLQSFDLASNETRSMDDRKAGLVRAAQQIGEIVKAVRGRIETQVQAFQQ